MFNYQSVRKCITSLNSDEKLNIKSAEVLSIGNNNDISMLKAAGSDIDVTHATVNAEVNANEIYDVS